MLKVKLYVKWSNNKSDLRVMYLLYTESRTANGYYPRVAFINIMAMVTYTRNYALNICDWLRENPPCLHANFDLFLEL